MNTLRFLAAVTTCLLAALPVAAQVPQLINYQGRVAANGTNFDGTGQFKFALVSATGTTTYWSNDGSSTAGSEPTAAVAITVSKGLYSVLLGDATQAHMTLVPATVFTHADVHLRIWFNDGTNGSQLLAPDKRIAAVGYALMADSVSDAAITTAKVADGAITTAKVADGAVTSAKLAPGVVQTSNLASAAVGNAQLANPALTVTAGSGLSGGGLVALGGSITLGNSGVLTITAGSGITTDASSGAITLGSTATSANTPAAIVARDASGNFSAGTITAALAGNATTATSAISFTGALAGDVTGTQAATSIAATTVTGKTLTGFTATPGPLTAADTVLTALGKLDANTSLKAPLASPSFTGTVLLPAGTPTAAPLRLQSGDPLSTPAFGAVEFDGTNLFVTNNSASPTRKTVAFTDSAISSAQLADGSVTSAKLAAGAVGSAQLASTLTLVGTTTGSFTGNLTGNAATATTAGSATSFTGTLAGNVTGTQAATVVASVGGVAAAAVASGATLSNAATDASTASTVVKRDASGNFSAGTITASLLGNAATATTAANFSGALVGDVTGTQAATAISATTVTGKAITGFASTTGTISAADTILSALGKLDANTALKAPISNPSFTGTVTATAFVGNGSGLTSIPANAVASPPPGMMLIPAGAFTMGNSVVVDTDITNAVPISTTVSAFYMDVNEVTLSQWQSVYYWAKDNGYTDLPAGSGKGPNHPVQTVSWWDAVKWCNARSEQAGKTPVYFTNDAQTTLYKTGSVNVTNAQVKWTANGYRLPTEAEWEKAARGGRSGQRFPWGNTITQNLANYYGNTGLSYDMGPNGNNATGSIGGTSPATSPVGSFAANGFGLNDMAGNVFEWCWDWYGTPYAGGTDPHGAATGSFRVFRGGGWNYGAYGSRCAYRYDLTPVYADFGVGFRSVLPPAQP